MFLAELFFASAIGLLVLRFATWGKEGRMYAVMDFVSVMFMIFAFYFFVFGGTSTTNMTSIATNETTLGNVITISNTTTIASHVAVTSHDFIFLVAATSAYALIVLILGLRDFVAARQLNTEGMP